MQLLLGNCFLRRRGIDALSAHDAGRCGLGDPEQLTFAASEQRVLVTFDTDFLALHQAGATHAGIAWCPALKYSIGELLKVLVLLHAVMAPDDMQNHVEHL